MSDYGEPWRLATGCNDDICDALDHLVAVAYVPHRRRGGEEAARAEQLRIRQRIVACVNACAGIPTEVLKENRALFAQEATRFDTVTLAHRERRERAALAALTGLLAHTGWNSAAIIDDAVHLADALCAALAARKE